MTRLAEDFEPVIEEPGPEERAGIPEDLSLALMVVAFGEAALEGDVERLVALLHPDAVLTTDGGGVAIDAVRNPDKLRLP